MSGKPTLFSDIRALKGVGARRAEHYAKLGILTPHDLLYHFPRGYTDLSSAIKIAEATPGENAAVKCALVKKLPAAGVRKNLTVYKAVMTDFSERFTAVFYNNRYAFDSLREDGEYILYGKVNGNLTRWEMASPMIIPADCSDLIRPTYGLTEGLTNAMVQTNIREALSLVEGELFDEIPPEILRRNSLAALRFALENIHFPKDELALCEAKRRLAFDELFLLQLGMLTLKGRNRAESGCRMSGTDISEYFSALPFEMTGAQKRAVADVTADMCGGCPMNRLIQGDVGSGKTAVAAAACYFAHKNGFQSALMAPTEILAAQHYATLSGLLSPLGVNVCLLTGSLKQKERTAIREGLSSGEYSAAVGTHALIQQSTEFRSLGLVITDEQHRFGVTQRATLAMKGKNPHKLVMSATPIPRTLALIIYGDLDITVIDELPRGRQPIETYAVTGKLRHRAFGFLKKQLDSGRQGYIVCPAIEEGDGELTAVTTYAKKLTDGEFSGYSVAVLHGRMPPQEKDEIMHSFKDGNIQLLVSTTVVEVGIDVPNATVMLIEDADRFGLSQLHQLRGRVGRGGYQSYCILVTENVTDDVKKRLRIMSETSDGFKISEEDLRLRGPGDFFGSRQHGLPPLKIADMATDSELLAAAQSEAKRFISECRIGDYPALSAAVERIFSINGENGMN